MQWLSEDFGTLWSDGFTELDFALCYDARVQFSKR